MRKPTMVSATCLACGDVLDQVPSREAAAWLRWHEKKHQPVPPPGRNGEPEPSRERSDALARIVRELEAMAANPKETPMRRTRAQQALNVLERPSVPTLSAMLGTATFPARRTSGAGLSQQQEIEYDGWRSDD